MSCPGCESKGNTTIYSCGFQQQPIRQFLEHYYSQRISIEYFNEATYILDKCNNCGLIYQREIPNDFLMKKLYQDWLNPKKKTGNYRDSARLYAKLDYHARNTREIMMLIAYFKVDPEKLHFLDAGMGYGSWCLMAKAFGVNVSGIELSRYLIELGKSRGLNVISWNELEEKRFDFINTEQFFEHVGNPLETLRYLKKSLKTNGLIKISVPDGGKLKRRLDVFGWTTQKSTKNHLLLVHPLEHINCFNRFSVIQMAKLVGLKEVKMPIWLQYIYSTNWRPVRRMIKNLFRPIYYNVLQKGTYLFFRRETGVVKR